MKLRIKGSWSLTLGVIITGVMLVMILVGFIWTPYDSDAMSASERFDAPSFAHIMGTDNFGRDVFSRVLEGAGTTLIIASATVLIGLVVGLIIGSLTAYYGGWLDELLMRVADAISAFPSILLAMVLISIIGTGKYKVIIALGIVFIPSFSRLVRGEVLRCKEMDYVHSARLMGASDLRIIFVHILPNTVPVLLSGLAIGFNNAVLAEASMSFLSIGVTPPDASLGRMLSEAQTYLFRAPWYALFPGLTIILLILGVSLIGDGITERLGD